MGLINIQKDHRYLFPFTGGHVIIFLRGSQPMAIPRAWIWGCPAQAPQNIPGPSGSSSFFFWNPATPTIGGSCVLASLQNHQKRGTDSTKKTDPSTEDTFWGEGNTGRSTSEGRVIAHLPLLSVSKSKRYGLAHPSFTSDTSTSEAPPTWGGVWNMIGRVGRRITHEELSVGWKTNFAFKQDDLSAVGFQASLRRGQSKSIVDGFAKSTWRHRSETLVYDSTSL